MYCDKTGNNIWLKSTADECMSFNSEIALDYQKRKPTETVCVSRGYDIRRGRLRYTVQREGPRDEGSCSDAMGSDTSPHYRGECKRRNSGKKSRHYGWSRDALED